LAIQRPTPPYLIENFGLKCRDSALLLGPIMIGHRSKEWKLFREEVIHLDGGVCVRCSRGVADGELLHVHHKFYAPGRKPWEYPYEACETLCRSCHAQEHGIIPPKDGRELVGDYDLGDLSGSCDYCRTEIRYVFVIQHCKWITLEV